METVWVPQGKYWEIKSIDSSKRGHFLKPKAVSQEMKSIIPMSKCLVVFSKLLVMLSTYQ